MNSVQGVLAVGNNENKAGGEAEYPMTAVTRPILKNPCGLEVS
jgi:hypothetical protein